MRTHVYAFPRGHLIEDAPIPPQIFYSQDGVTAAVVSDLIGYFEKVPGESRHYSIDVSLRSGVHDLWKRSTDRTDTSSSPVFVVIEEYAGVAPTSLSEGQCYLIDEWRDGQAMLEGGREGEKALLAFPTLGDPWPEVEAGRHTLNVVLAAVKVEQNATGHLRELYSCSCFVSDKEEAVYPLTLSMSAMAQVTTPLTRGDLEKKGRALEAMLEGMMSDSDPVAMELFDALIIDKNQDDGYLRLSYLRLWQAMEDARRHVGQSGLLNERTIIAGKRTPVELKKYRNEIAHWHTGRIDQSFLADLQYTAMELLRRKYGG
ncbi:hypothetical protein [Candidatus Palauibacter sp.]|uniref:hypothetical protein n=1 Tax=Candidatus Palauibacter sp. TaxID=3101350 RepID=UPI003B02D5C0